MLEDDVSTKNKFLFFGIVSDPKLRSQGGKSKKKCVFFFLNPNWRLYLITKFTAGNEFLLVSGPNSSALLWQLNEDGVQILVSPTSWRK